MGDQVFLKAMPKRGVVRFGKQGKLSPRYIGPFEILEKLGTVAHRLALPSSLSSVYVWLVTSRAEPSFEHFELGLLIYERARARAELLKEIKIRLKLGLI